MSNPTRRTLLGAAGAAALSRILLPWTPRPSDLLLADETPAKPRHPALRIERFPNEPISYSKIPPSIVVHDGMSVTLNAGRWAIVVVLGGCLRIEGCACIDCLQIHGGHVEGAAGAANANSLPYIGSLECYGGTVGSPCNPWIAAL